MSADPPDDPAQGHRRARRLPDWSRLRSGGRWRLLTPLVVVVSGGLFAVSAVNAHGTDLRPGRYTDLASLVQSDADDYQGLRAQVAALDDQVGQLSAQVDDKQVRRQERRVTRLETPAGLSAVSGPGVTVVLSDAPLSKREDVAAAGDSSDVDPRRLIVHQQDIQAVVNAMWRGGATAVTVQGQRLVSTTGIKCTGNSVQLQGVPYPAPYRIQAVGDPTALLTAIDADAAIQGFRDDAADPDVDVGFEDQAETKVTAPAYDGLVDLTSAKPLN